MPYKDKDEDRRHRRNRDRTRYHGPNWRQVFIDSGGGCAYLVVDDPPTTCGSLVCVQLHHTLRRWTEEVLLCEVHHSMIHNNEFNINPYAQPHKSVLAEDIEKEVLDCGGSDAWIKQYGLDDSRFGILSIYKNAEGRVVVCCSGEEEFVLEKEV